MRTIDYDAPDKGTGNTETNMAVDEKMRRKAVDDLQHAYEEGFAASDGVRGGTAESEGIVKHPERIDESLPTRENNSIANENPGLADN